LTQSCSQDPRDCAEWEPYSLIYCLSRDEQYWGRDALLKRWREKIFFIKK